MTNQTTTQTIEERQIEIKQLEQNIALVTPVNYGGMHNEYLRGKEIELASLKAQLQTAIDAQHEDN